MNRRCFFAGMMLTFVAGCTGSSEPALQPVAGVVTLDGKTLEDARIQFIPQGDTPGHGGRGLTDAAGRYEIITAKAENRKGLQAGSYKVIVSRKRRPDGSAPPPDVPDMKSDAVETVPAPYSHRHDSPLMVTVGSGPVTFDIPLKK